MMHVSHTAGSFQSPYSSNKFKNIQNFTGGFCVNGASSKQGGFCVCGACVRVCVCVCVAVCVGLFSIWLPLFCFAALVYLCLGSPVSTAPLKVAVFNP
jgi:hypothetical protein